MLLRYYASFARFAAAQANIGKFKSTQKERKNRFQRIRFDCPNLQCLSVSDERSNAFLFSPALTLKNSIF